MRATYIYGAGDIRVINVPDPAIQLIPATLVCGREEYGCLAFIVCKLDPRRVPPQDCCSSRPA